MHVLTAEQMREADRFTIDHSPISSLDLMERAATACFKWFKNNFNKHTPVHVVCGQGNNGGDGLIMARLLLNDGYDVTVSLLITKPVFSSDCQANLKRLQLIKEEVILPVSTVDQYIGFNPGSVIVDAIFGTGFSGKTDELTASVIRKINASNLPVVSIDLPSGIRCDESSLKSGNEIVKASETLTFQYRKPAMFAGENEAYFGRITVIDIGLLPEALSSMNIQFHESDSHLINSLFKPKREFSHKGTFGHSLLITGEEGKMGAAILAARGYLKSGAGLLTLGIPEEGLQIIQVAVPEAMAVTFKRENPVVKAIDSFNIIGAGPGLGTGETAVALIYQILEGKAKQLVLDADALNILAMNPDLFSRLPADTILTPHPGEFNRMAGSWTDDFDKLNKQREFAKKYSVYVILKGKNSSIACPDGTIWFNTTGNAGMAKGGSGDVLTGLITGLRASGYNALDACLLGTWLHGLAGDIAAELLSQEGMNAGDLIDFLPNAWKTLQQ